jgi:hypothetical protein
MPARIRRLLAAVHEHVAVLLELSERQDLLNRPWEREYMHWSNRDGCWRLHGHRAVPDDGRRRGVTRGGWCPCPRIDHTQP